MWEQAFAMTHQPFGIKQPCFFILRYKYFMYVGNKVNWGPVWSGRAKKLADNQRNKCSKCRAIRERRREGVKDVENEKLSFQQLLRKENIHLWMAICWLSRLSPVAWVKSANKTPQRAECRLCWGRLDWFTFPNAAAYKKRLHVFVILATVHAVWQHVCVFTWADVAAKLTSARTVSTLVSARVLAFFSGISVLITAERGLLQ